MLLSLTALCVAQARTANSGTVADQIAAGQAIASYELASWKKTHPKADLSLTFNDPAVKPAQANVIRERLGYQNPLPKLDPQVLTLVFDGVARSGARRLSMDAYVFLGSFPKGFRARYLIRTDGKTPKVVSRTVLQRYDLPTDA